MKKTISVLLSICMLFSMSFSLNISAFALSNSGKCSDDESVSYTFNSLTGQLVISGDGEMSDYASGKSPFYKGNDIKSVVINDGVKSIGDYAFESCGELISVDIADSVARIGNSAFSSCGNLSNIPLSDNLAFIGEDAFKDTRYYNETENWISYNENNKTIYSVLYIGNHLIELKAEENDLFVYSIKDGTKTICDKAFYKCNNLTQITIPNSVRNIGNSSFSECTGLTNLEFPNSVKSIGDYAFYGCSGLTSIEIPNSVTSIGNYAFYNCTGLTSVEIPNSVTSIGSHAFYNCKAITELSLGNGVESIGSWAFRGCKGVLTLVIPDSVESIGKSAFYACSGLKKVYINSINKWCNIEFIDLYSNPLYYAHNLYLGDELLTDLVIPEGVESIGNYSFYKCTSLKSAKIAKSVESIGDYSFKLCSALNSLIMEEGLKTIGYSAFSECAVLTDILIPDSVTSIGASAFKLCNALKSVKLSNNLESINDNLFYGCSTLKNVVVPDKVKNIGKYAFYACKDLANVEITDNPQPYTTITIDDYSFSGCSSLKIICLPNRVTSLGSYAFYDCISLKSVGMPNGLTAIEDGTFFNCEELQSVVIPSGVTRIGYYAFTNCDKLNDVFYCNSEAEWKAISVENYNDELINAAVHYNYVPCVNHSGSAAVKENIVAATYDKAGSYDEVVYCSVCGEALSLKTVSIEKLKKTSLSKAKVSGIKNKTYTGKELTQSMTVKLGSKTLKKGTDYKIAYKDNKNVGKVTVTITGINAYSGTITKTFKINPMATILSSLTSESKGFSIKWKKRAAQITGYQIQYSTDKNFKKNNKTLTVNNYKTTSKTISKLKGKTKYYVRIRTYKTVSGTKYYSSWSSAKTVTTKK